MKTFVYATVCALVAGLIKMPVLAKQASKEEAACLNAYHKVQEALVKDDLAGAKKDATDLAAKAKAANNESIAGHADALAKSDSLDTAREHFKAISDECIKMASNVEGQYVFNCPMKNADWLQTSKDKVENPYMGKKMLSCGQLKK
jgi:Protein of unknown function (DUF3347)